MILITTAGKVGSEAARLLAQRGAPVRVLVRNPQKATALAQAGVDVAEGDLDAPATIDAAVRDGPLGALAPIAESAADLLEEGDPSLLKKCENPDCVLHFYDTSKNHARRWCSMSGCGNRMKAQAHYRRRQRGAQP